MRIDVTVAVRREGGGRGEEGRAAEKLAARKYGGFGNFAGGADRNRGAA